MRAPSPSDFEVELPGVGVFIYGRRTYGDRVRIRQQYLLVLGSPNDDDIDKDVAGMAAIIAAHRVLCVRAPEGWADLEKLDLIMAPENEGRVLELYAQLKAKEDSFRRVPNAPSPG